MDLITKDELSNLINEYEQDLRSDLRIAMLLNDVPDALFGDMKEKYQKKVEDGHATLTILRSIYDKRKN